MTITPVILHTIDPYAIEFSSGFGIRWYGLAYIIGFVAGYYIITAFSRRGLSSLKVELVSDFVFWVAIGTIVGGRLGYCVFYSPELFFQFTSDFPFWGVLFVHHGGMASHGGMIGIVVAALLFARKHKLNALHLFDLTVLGATVGIFFGRIANFINGELLGRPCARAYQWCVQFPHEILLWINESPERLKTLGPTVKLLGTETSSWNSWVDTHSWHSIEALLVSIITAVQNGNDLVSQAARQVLTPRHPSQLYEALLEGLFLFLVLLFYWRLPRKAGMVTAIFFILYAIVRIIGEQFRLPDAQIGYQLLGLTRGQWLSVGLLIVGAVLFARWKKMESPYFGGWLR